MDAVSYFIPNFTFKNKNFLLLQIVADALYTLVTSFNFLIYVTMSTKFAGAYKKLFKSMLARVI